MSQSKISKSTKRDTIINLYLTCDFLLKGEPLFRCIDKIPNSKRQILSSLKSEDIKDDIWYVRT